MLCHIKDILKDAEKGHYAVGAFNVQNFESALGIARAAVKMKSPAIIQVSEGAIKYMGLKPITHIVSTIAKNIATYVPIALHLDHGKSFDSVFECINAGFSSVHIDASDLPLDENIALTKRVVEVAHSKDVWVQGEVGVMIGGHGKVGDRIENIPMADLDDVVKFVKETGVDTVAAAVGTAHGSFSNETVNVNLVKGIKEKAKVPFVLHGGSGISDELIKKGIDAGINIINIGTDIKVAFCSTLVQECQGNPQETDPRKLLTPTIDAIIDVVAEKMRLFGSADQVEIIAVNHQNYV